MMSTLNDTIARENALEQSQSPGSSREPNTHFLDTLTGYALRRASKTVMDDFAREMQGTGMRPVLVAILCVVEENPGIRQGKVARTLDIARANMAPLMNELAERNLISRIEDETDRRAVSVFLSRQGEALLKLCKARIAAHEQHVLKRLSDAEQALLRKMLQKIF